MISRIILDNIASYAGRTEIPLRKLNFIYGSNGSGKTTISKILKSPESYFDCEIDWDREDHEEVLVYNRPFVDKNFASESLLGIFTLGEDSIAVQHEIEVLRKNIDQATTEREGFKTRIKNFRDALAEEKHKTIEACWELQTKYGQIFPEAMSGGRNSKERFFQMCLDAYKVRSSTELIELQALKEKNAAAYAKRTSEITSYAVPSESQLEALKGFDLLKKVITGKSDTPIGTFIQYLQASDWVKQGVAFAKRAGGKCPYCHRDLPESIEQEIEDFFDEAYIADCDQIKQYHACYVTVSDMFIASVQSILDNKYDILDYEKLEKKFELFKEIIKRNTESIKRKIDTPSDVIGLEEVFDIAVAIVEIVRSFNSKIDEHNQIINNQSIERENIKKLVWRFIIAEVEDSLDSYQKQETGINNGIKSLDGKCKEKEELMRDLNEQAEALESKLTSVRPTVVAINKILEGFGFDGFQLAESTEKIGTYSIIRKDGTDASNTLSEGEHNFLTFLYFYHLCFGSQSSTGLLKDRVLVIDDPISSMDSSVLFIVSTLVKTMISHCRNNEKGIRQVIVLTHNIYFHKEITFLGNRESFRKNEVAFFILRKKNEQTSVESFEENPIMSSYEMLWEDLRNPSSSTSKGVFNTMRRILEYYFAVIGGINYEQCINQFEGEDKLACKALVAYINDGSHSVYDDLIVPIEDSALENYQRTFRLIFEKMNHIDHYNMMMRNKGY